jgi:hypothetical protein
MRRIAISLSGLLALAVAFLTAAPAAFAMKVAPPAGGSRTFTASQVAHHAGLSFWAVSLIVLAGVVALSVAIGAAVISSSRRSPATAAIS